MARHTLWQIPSLHTEGDRDEHRKVTWLELFFDLFFVVGISQLSYPLLGPIPPARLTAYALLFIPLWWTWISFTIYQERFETDGLDQRLFTFLFMVPVAGMAVYARDAFGDCADEFAGSYLIGRILVVFLWGRAAVHSPRFRRVGWAYVSGFSTSALCFALSFASSGPFKYTLWAAGLAADLCTPWFTIKEQAKLPRLATSKVTERYGLFVIIVLGEVVVGLISGLSQNHVFTAATLVSALLGLAVGFGLWWIYFDFVGRRPPSHSFGVTICWSYLHMPLVLALAATGPGLLNVVTGKGAFWLLPAVVGAALIIMGLMALTLHREPTEPTHAWTSLLVKWIAAGGLFLLSAMNPWSAHATLAVVLAALALPMIYGTWACFRQDVESSPAE
jgi:low temperature requirement protein LtrA